VSLHSFTRPWAAPIVRLLRHPFRLNVLLFLSLAVASAFGCRRLLKVVRQRRPALVRAVPLLLALVMLFEYLVWPFPYTEPVHSPFFDELARDEGDFAVAHIPMGGRTQEMFYLYYQTIHGKRITSGVVSRMPEQVYAFIDANPLLGALRGNVPPWWGVDVREQFAALASEGIEYVIVHRSLMDAGQLENWHRWVGCFPPPLYRDAALFAYSTTPLPSDTRQAESLRQANVQLGDYIQLEAYQLSSSTVTAGDVLYLTLFWTGSRPADTDYHVFVHLTDEQGTLVAQHDSSPAYGARPTYQWSAGETITDQHSLFTDLSFPPGTYVLSIGMYDYATMTRLTAVGPDGGELPDGVVVLQNIEVVGP